MTVTNTHKETEGSGRLTEKAQARGTHRIMDDLTQTHVAVVGLSTYRDVYMADPLERVARIRHGVPASLAESTSREIGYSKERLFSMLRFPRATINRKITGGEMLSPEFSERLLGLQKVIGQVEVMVAESGNPEGFSAPQWVGQWLEQPCPALGNEKPVDYMDTLEGQELVSSVLAKMQSGAYA